MGENEGLLQAASRLMNSADENDLQLRSQSFISLRRTSEGTPQSSTSLRPCRKAILISLMNGV